jgi:uncharacterized protein
MTTLSQRPFEGVVDADSLRTYIQRVYTWMVGGLLVTAATAFGVASSAPVQAAIFSNSIIYWIVLLAPLGIVFFLSARLDKIKPSTAASLFVVFSVLMGLSLSSIFLIYELGSIGTTFIVAAGMYGGAALYGYTTKRDLTGMGSFLFMGLIGLILASIVNWFIGSSALEFAVSVIGVLIFTGLTAYDMQRIKDQAIVMYTDDGRAAKMSIISALSLYLNFLNLFLFLLRLLGDRR